MIRGVTRIFFIFFDRARYLALHKNLSLVTIKFKLIPGG